LLAPTGVIHKKRRAAHAFGPMTPIGPYKGKPHAHKASMGHPASHRSPTAGDRVRDDNRKEGQAMVGSTKAKGAAETQHACAGNPRVRQCI